MGHSLALCYHAVSEEWTADLSVTPDRFAEQIELLAQRGYRGVTFSDLVCRNHPGNAVAVTFDDAYRSVKALAMPILERFGMPGTVFVPTRFPELDVPMAWPGIDIWLGTPHEDELLPMTWAELRELREGGWEIGSHTVTHPHLTQLSDEALTRELSDSREECRRNLGAPCVSIAYPYGDTDPRVAAAARGAGYRFGAALPTGAWRGTSELNWPRVGIYHREDLASFRKKTSPFLLRLRGSRAWPVVASAWRRLRY